MPDWYQPRRWDTIPEPSGTFTRAFSQGWAQGLAMREREAQRKLEWAQLEMQRRFREDRIELAERGADLAVRKFEELSQQRKDEEADADVLAGYMTEIGNARRDGTPPPAFTGSLRSLKGATQLRAFQQAMSVMQARENLANAQRRKTAEQMRIEQKFTEKLADVMRYAPDVGTAIDQQVRQDGEWTAATINQMNDAFEREVPKPVAPEGMELGGLTKTGPWGTARYTKVVPTREQQKLVDERSKIRAERRAAANKTVDTAEKELAMARSTARQNEKDAGVIAAKARLDEAKRLRDDLYKQDQASPTATGTEWETRTRPDGSTFRFRRR